MYIAIQLLLPLRHHLYEGNPSWTEEGHRFAWRMMLRGKKAHATFTVLDPVSCEKWLVHPSKYLTNRQARKLKTHPDMIVQFAHYLSSVYKEKGYPDVEVYVYARAGLNGRKKQDFIKEDVDLAKIAYNPYQKADWIVPLEE